MFELDGEYKTKLDFGKTASPKVAELIALEVLLLDEVSMVDKLCFEGIQTICSIIDHSRRNGVASSDPFGSVHLLLFGDFKQLPPASSEAPFIILPSVYGTFDFRVLRQNRRVVQEQGREAELENFHTVLSDISMGIFVPGMHTPRRLPPKKTPLLKENEGEGGPGEWEAAVRCTFSGRVG